MNKKEKLEKVLRWIPSNDLVYIYNCYCNDNQYSKNIIYNMQDFDNVMCGKNPMIIALGVYYGNFKPNDDYFNFDNYGNLNSICCHILTEKLINDFLLDYILNNKHDFNIPQIAELL